MVNVELVRQEWEDGYRRFLELTRDPDGGSPAYEQVDALVEQLRRRVGSSFTLTELAESYEAAERWAYETLEERSGRPGWIAAATVALDAAYHLYARGAQDYRL